MKKKEFKFEKDPDTIWIMNNQIYEDFKNSLNNLEYNTDTSAEHYKIKSYMRGVAYPKPNVKRG